MFKKVNSSSSEDKKKVVAPSDKANDETVIRYIYERYADNLLSYGLNLGFRKETVEDVIHDLFYKLCLSPQLLKSVNDLKFYLFRALKNKLLNNSKSSENKINLVTNDFSEFNLTFRTDTLHQLIEKEEQLLIQKKMDQLLNSLSSKQKEIIFLRFIHEMTYEEIAAILNMTSASVKNVVYKALKKIRQRIWPI